MFAKGAPMREEWLRHQIQVCELHVREERQRLEHERQRAEREALITQSLPELMSEVSDPQDESQISEPARVH
jgi:hypothetical protein